MNTSMFYSKKIIINVILSIGLLFFVQTLPAQIATAPEIGNGTAISPYEISTWQQLYWISQNSAEWDKHFKQTANIDFADASPAINTWSSGAGWPMIGSYTSYSEKTPFTGVYDGNGHTISGLYIKRPSTKGVAFFAYTEGAQVKNLGLLNVMVEGNEAVSALVGRTDLVTLISNCFATGAITSGSYYGMVGGLIGYHSGNSLIQNSYSTASVTGTRSGGTESLGGLIGGTHTARVTNCYSTGLVSGGVNYYGGLIGYNMATVSNSFWDTQTSGQTTSAAGTGKTTSEMKEGILYIQAAWDFMDETVNGTEDLWGINAMENNGYPFLAWQGYTNDTELSLTTGYVTNISPVSLSATANGTIFSLGSPAPTQHGFCWNTSGNPTLDDNYTAEGVPAAGVFSSQLTELTLHQVYYVRAYVTNSIETVYGNEIVFVLTGAVAPSVGIGSSSSPYEIANLENLLWLSENQSEWSASKYFVQTANIDAAVTQYLNEGKGFSPIGTYNAAPFQGSYNGQGYAIDGLYINRTENDYNAFFGYLTGSASIKNLRIENVNITGTGAAALVGCLYSSTASIADCYASGSVSSSSGHSGAIISWLAYGTINRSISDVEVLGGSYTGGFAGRIQSGKVYNCYASGSVAKHSSAISFVYAGGFAGAIDATSTVSNCFSTSAVGAANTLGGFVAYFSSSTVTNCFWDIQTSGLASSAAGTGKTTAEMKVYSLFYDNNWDFKGETKNGINEIWNIGNSRNNGYPYLNWQYPDDLPPFLTWTGASSTSWDLASNWNYNVVPAAGNHVSIPVTANKPEISNTQSCYDVLIAAGAVLTLNPNGILTVQNKLINNAGTSGLVIQSNAGSTGHLLNHSAGVAAKVEQFISDDGWHYMGTPFSEATTVLPAFKGLWIIQNDEGTAQNNSETGWNYLSGSDVIVAGKGYGFHHDLDTTISFSGTLNTGDINVNTAFTLEGWNFVANPYPCTIDWEIVDNNLLNVYDAIYVWDPSLNSGAGNYAYWVGETGTNGQNQYIAPMQGFFVKAESAGSITFTNDAKSTSASTFKSSNIQSLIRLSVSDAKGASDETVIRIHPSASEKFDGKFDAFKLKAGSSISPQLFSVYNGDAYAINSLPTITSETIIPLEIMIKTSGKHSLVLSEISAFDDAFPIVLLDVSNKILARLESEDYEFEATAGETVQLFLAFSTSVSINNATLQNLFARGSKQQIIIGRMDNVEANVTIYDMKGQIIFSKLNVVANDLVIPLAQQGIYVVKVQNPGGKMFTAKVLVTK